MAWSKHDLERWGLDAFDNHTNTHKYAQTHTHTHKDKTQSEVTQVRWEVKESIPVNGLNLLTEKTSFR